jgi:nucleolar protein 56
MTSRELPTVVSSWERTVLLEEGRIVREETAPRAPEALAERVRRRRSGRLTPEEEALLRSRGEAQWRTRDRRLAGSGIEYDPTAPGTLAEALGPGPLREVLLDEAERDLAEAWDPSIHLEEAVRAARELDRAANQVGERLASWAAKDTPGLDAGEPGSAAEAVLRETGAGPLGPADLSVVAARRGLAEAYRALVAARDGLRSAVSAAAPTRAPNLAALLGPDLAAQLLAHAGGLDRLARLPASTIQVLGAERAFFEHLRGRAPPPRHGLLFLHPAIRSASRRERGRLARTLAAKAAIAARLDRAGSPVDPTLGKAFEARRESLRAQRGKDRGRSAPAASAAPLDRAARHRDLRR